MMDRIFIIGRITKDLELRQTSTGKDVVSYTLAVPISKDLTEFINCTTFGEFAKTLCTYCSKGDLIAIEGQLRTNTYTDTNNIKRTSYYVATDKVMFLNTKKKSEEQSVEKTDIIIKEEDLPF